jgi:outer membrane protein OmpA-like peptidoglycan-associated protein
MMNRIFSYCLVSILSLVRTAAFAQSYLAENIGPQVNSSYDEINPVISPDGQQLFFTRVNHPENNFGEADSEDIWVSNLQGDGSWSSPSRLSNLNIGRYNAVLSVSEDGNTVLINGVYNRKGNAWKKRGLSLSVKNKNEWSAPEQVKIPALSRRNKGLKSSASMSADGKFLVLSFSSAHNSERSDIYISEKKKNEQWKRPKKIRQVNSMFSEDSPFLSSDNKTLYFASDRRQKNVFDIYRSVRTSETEKWSAPILLSDTVNSSSWDSYFKTNTKGSIAYFSSTRVLTNGADIYAVKLIEENPYVVITGKVRNEATAQTITSKKFTVMVEGNAYKDLNVNIDSGNYKVTLPRGKKYVLSAALPEYISIPDTIDLSTTKDFSNVKRDLLVRPLPYIVVKGKMLMKKSGEIVSEKAVARITVDGVVSDSAYLHRHEGTYELKVKHGKAYTLQIAAKDLEGIPAQLDLTMIKGYQEITLDLLAQPREPGNPVKVATVLVEKVEVPVEVKVSEPVPVLISGRVINKKTGDAFVNNSSLRVMIEGPGKQSPEIEIATGKYKTSLLSGNSVVISASAPGFYPIYETIDLTKQKSSSLSIDLYLAPIEVGQSIRLNNIFFEPGKATLKKESYRELERVVSFLEDNTDMKIEIAGHTDNVGEASMNEQLSRARAKAVATYIISKGIRASRVVTKGYGSSKPVSSNDTTEGKTHNRRVEFTILTR